MENMKYFKGSFLVAIIGAFAALMIGGMEALFLVAILSVLEVSLSFDNAVVNATVLKDMDAKWRKRFLTWGILIAVFGMRVIFPVIVVAVVAGITPWAAIDVAINNPASYAEYMKSAHVSLMGFGGAFLMMVGLDFFLDDEKEEHWLPMIETKIQSIGKFNFMPTILTFSAMLSIGIVGLGDHEFKDFITSGIAGIATFLAIHKLAQLMEKREEKRSKALGKAAASGGFAMFMYLEILDASFSFDGVIGAFAITTNLFIIAVGLGIGAMFVRSLTILFVEKDTLTEYEYLEHGAFYAIVALAGIMLLKSAVHISEVITGLIGAVFIGAAFVHSIHKKKQDETLALEITEKETKDQSCEMKDELAKDAEFEEKNEVITNELHESNEIIQVDIIKKAKASSLMTSEIADKKYDKEDNELDPAGTDS
jgi:hypothetical protein